MPQLSNCHVHEGSHAGGARIPLFSARPVGTMHSQPLTKDPPRSLAKFPNPSGDYLSPLPVQLPSLLSPELEIPLSELRRTALLCLRVVSWCWSPMALSQRAMNGGSHHVLLFSWGAQACSACCSGSENNALVYLFNFIIVDGGILSNTVIKCPICPEKDVPLCVHFKLMW